MATKKQERAKQRIGMSKQRKSAKFGAFLRRLAKRRVKNPEHRRISLNFCCRPDSLGMSRDQLLAKGQQLVGGAAAFFDHGELKALLPGWICQRRSSPTVLVRSYIEENYQVDGRYRDPYYDPDRDTWV